MDELRQLRDHHDAQPDPPPASITDARARLAAHIRHPTARKSPWLSAARRVRPVWGLGLAGATALALVVASMAGAPEADRVLPPVQPSAPSLHLRQVANAEDLANNAAVLAAEEPDSTPKPTQWAYMKSKVVQPQVDGGSGLFGTPKVTHTREMWRRADEKQFAYIENGELKVVDGSEFEVTYPYLLSLPTEPTELLARVYEQIDAEEASRSAQILQRQEEMAKKRGKSAEDARREAEAATPRLTAEERNTFAFQHIAQGMRDAVLPLKLRAAMYGAMAKIPGVRYEPRSTDLAKRSGVTLYRLHAGYLRDEIFINPKTYAYMGYRTLAVRSHQGSNSFPVKKGQIIGWDSLLETAIVDKPGQRS